MPPSSQIVSEKINELAEALLAAAHAADKHPVAHVLRSYKPCFKSLKEASRGSCSHTVVTAPSPCLLAVLSCRPVHAALAALPSHLSISPPPSLQVRKVVAAARAGQGPPPACLIIAPNIREEAAASTNPVQAAWVSGRGPSA